MRNDEVKRILDNCDKIRERKRIIEREEVEMKHRIRRARLYHQASIRREESLAEAEAEFKQRKRKSDKHWCLKFFGWKV